jgi:DNA polymerase III epsilon subunit-like protein
MPFVLVFDVETTGLLPKDLKDYNPCDLPHIIQLSYALYDTDIQTMKETYNAYIRIPSDIVIKPLITDLTGITREKLDEEGIDIIEAIEEFNRVYELADIIVGHNLQFDMTMVLIDGCPKLPHMHGMFDNAVLNKAGKQVFCTMQSSIDICKMKRFNSRGSYYKQPKLSELYAHLFGKEPDNLHNSVVDVAACLRCFLKMKYRLDISEDAFAKWCLLA